MEEDEARVVVERVNELLRRVNPSSRGPVRSWLADHGYPATIPVMVKASDAPELESILRTAVEREDTDNRRSTPG